MLKDKKIIITGALGLVGKELLKIFCETNQKIYAVDLHGQISRYADFIKNIKKKNKNIHFIIEPYIRFKGLVGEQATMFFKDPSGNALEFKSFKNPSQIFAK